MQDHPGNYLCGAAAAESAALINTAFQIMLLLLPLCCVFIRIGRRRATPREILSTGTDRRDVRRAETAWRREYADRAPPVGETTAALRALGAVRDGHVRIGDAVAIFGEEIRIGDAWVNQVVVSVGLR